MLLSNLFSSGGLDNVVEDTTPQLGGDLDVNGHGLGAQAVALNMNTHKVTGVVDPTADQEVATKKYVDDNAGGVSDEAYTSAWNGVTGTGASKNAIWDWTKPYTATVDSRPDPLGNHNSIIGAFDGDLTKLQFPVKHYILGAATLGQPASGYSYTPEAYPHYTYVYSNSGWNQSTAADQGRTATVAYKTTVYQDGLGDAVCFNGGVYVVGNKPGGTSWLANAAGVLLNGDVNAGANGVHLNAIEVNAQDYGFDVATNMLVINLIRTNNTGAKDTWWNGIRIQSGGSKATDSAFHLNGKALTGLDLTLATITNSAIALKVNQKISFDATAGTYNVSGHGTKYIKYDGTNLLLNGSSKVNGNLTVVNTLACDSLISTTLSAATHYFSTGNLSYVGGYISANTHVNVNGQLRCDQFRIDQNAQEGVITATHFIGIEVNGVAYKVLLRPM